MQWSFEATCVAAGARGIVVTALFSAAFSVAAQQGELYPGKPVRLVSSLAPGSSGDRLARNFAEQLSAQIKQNVLVENRTGDGGNIAAMYVVKALPDGYTLFVGSSGPLTVNPFVQAKLGYDPINDFAMVSSLGFFELAIVVDPTSPITSLEDLIQAAKDKPGTINLGTIGIEHHGVKRLGGELQGVRGLPPVKETGAVLGGHRTTAWLR